MTSNLITTAAAAAMALMSCVLAQTENPANQLPRGLEQFPGSADATELLRRQGFVVLRDAVLPETGKAPRQLFEGYIDAPVPTVITADVVLDGFFVLQGRVLAEIDEGMSESFRALVKAIDAVARKADCPLLRELSASATTMLEDASVSVESVLGRYKLVGELLPQGAPTNLGMPRGYGPSTLGNYHRARKLLQVCRFDMSRQDHRTAVKLLHDCPEVERAVAQLTLPLAGIFGSPSGSCSLFRSEDADSGFVGLLPCFVTPLDGLWEAIGNPCTLLPIVVNRGGVGGLLTTASFAGTVWKEWTKGYRDLQSLEHATVCRVVHALRLLQDPDPNAPPVFRSTEWRLLHANAQLASLACNERQMSPYTDLRVRGLVALETPPLVVPFSKHFVAVGAAAESLGVVRKRNLESGAKAAAPDELLERDLEEFARVCRTLADVCVMQTEGRALREDQSAVLDDVGVVMARMHRYVGNSYLSHTRNDHPRSVLVGIGRDGRGLTIGVGRPETLFVLVDRGAGPVLHRGLVFSYRECAGNDAPWLEGNCELGVPEAFTGYRRTR